MSSDERRETPVETELGYAPARGPQPVSYRLFIWISAGVLAFFLAAIGYRGASDVLQTWRLQRLESAVLDFERTEPIDVAKPAPAGHPWAIFYAHLAPPGGMGVNLWAGAMGEGDQQRVVGIDLLPSKSGRRDLSVDVIYPAKGLDPPRVLASTVEPGFELGDTSILTIDPPSVIDVGRVVLPFVLDGRSGELRVYLLGRSEVGTQIVFDRDKDREEADAFGKIE